MHPDARRLSAAQLLCTAAAFVAVGTLVALIDVPGAAWLAGAVAGACAAAVIAQRHARRRPPRAVMPGPAGAPAHVSAAAPAAARPTAGSRTTEAARATEAALATLEPSGWRAVHGVSWPYGTYDHIAIGRGGVILVANRRVDGDEPLDVIRHRVLADAAIIRQEMRRRAGRAFWVQALIVVWSDFPEGCVVDGRCVLVHGSRLAGWLERRPPQLRDDDIEVAFAAVAALGGAAATARAA